MKSRGKINMAQLRTVEKVTVDPWLTMQRPTPHHFGNHRSLGHLFAQLSPCFCRYMFWISRGSQPRIERATLSGNSKTTLVSWTSSWWLSNRPNGITLDFSANRLYWVDARNGRIESIDFNGNNRQRFKTLPFSSHPYDIVLYSGVFYYSDASSRSIDKIDKTTKQSLGSYTGLGASNFMRLAMFSPLRQPKGMYLSTNMLRNSGSR